jgi:hypothetical protein
MNCRYFQRHFQMKYFDRAMTAADQDRLWRHLNSCERCRACFTELQEILDSLPTIPSMTPPPDFERRIMDRIKQTPHTQAQPLKGPFTWRTPSGSILALIPLLLLQMILILGINLRSATIFDLVEPAGQIINHCSLILILIQNTWAALSHLFPAQFSGIMAQLQWMSLLIMITALSLLVWKVVLKLK